MPGCDGWPLTITGQPAASADAVSPPAVENASGKLEAPNTATGPSGTCMRRTSGLGIGTASGSGWSMIASASSPVSTIAANASSWPAVRSSSPRRRASGSPALGLGDGDDLVARRAQTRRGAAQQRRAPAAIAQGAGPVHGRGGRDGGADVLGRRLGEARPRLAGAGIDGVERERHGVYVIWSGERTNAV